MENQQFQTKSLYIIQPSEVIEDSTTRKENPKLNISTNTHKVTFRTLPKEITIAQRCPLKFQDIEQSKTFLTLIGNHCVEGDLYTGIKEGDKISLSQYLWEQQVQTPYTQSIENYIIQLKPFYTLEEIIAIINQIRQKQKKIEEETFTYKKVYKQPIFIKRQIYTDID